MQWESTLTHNDSKSGDSEEDRSAKWFFLSPLLVFASYVATFIVLSIVVPHRVDFPARPADIPWVPFLILGASLPILFSSAVILWILPSGRDRNFAWATQYSPGLPYSTSVGVAESCSQCLRDTSWID